MKHTKQPSNRKSENVLILFVLLIGLTGMLMAFSTQNDRVSPFSQPANLPVQSAQDRTNAELLEIGGQRKAGVPLHFQVMALDQHAYLIIDFGNGVEQRVRKDSFTFTYDQANRYQIKLKDASGKLLDYIQLDIAGGNTLAWIE